VTDSSDYRDYRDSAEYGRNGYRGSGSLPRDASRSKRQVPVDPMSAGLTRPASSMQTIAASANYGQLSASAAGYPNGSMQSHQPYNGKGAADFVDRDRQQQVPAAATSSASAIQQYDRVGIKITVISIAPDRLITAVPFVESDALF
jgi:hypothetical protein